MDPEPRLLHYVHLPAFDERAKRLLDDDDLTLLQQMLNDDPRAGAVIQGTGGVRKIRVAASGRGRRGGGRVLYLYVELRNRIYLIAVFTKNERPDFTPADYRNIKLLVQHLKREQ